LVVVAVAAVAVLVAAAGLVLWHHPAPRLDATFVAAGPASTAADGASAGPSASASASASASTSASPAPSKTRGAPGPVPRPGGKPGPGNTGVPPGVHLTVVNGDQTFAKDGQVVSGLDIHGFVRITARNVTLRNSIVHGGPNPKCNSSVVYVVSGASATIEDTEVSADFPNACLDGVWAHATTLTRVNIHGPVDGVKAYDNVVIQDSYIHDLTWFASDPNQGGGETHNDAVQTYEGNQHITLRHNTLNPGPKANAAYQVTQDLGKVTTDLHVVNNWLDWGGCSLNFSHKGGPAPMTGIYVSGNRFGRHSGYQCPIIVSTQTFLSQNSGNVWDDTGGPIPAPQRHD
jgi:hypothetical protein